MQYTNLLHTGISPKNNCTNEVDNDFRDFVPKKSQYVHK